MSSDVLSVTFLLGVLLARLSLQFKSRVKRMWGSVCLATTIEPIARAVSNSTQERPRYV
jgi:hypothetical protein